MSSMLEKTPRLIVAGLTETAKGEPCELKVPGVCNNDWATTVWAHSNMSRHGRGSHRKADDPFGSFACHACHYWLDYGKDATRAEKEEVFIRGMERTLFRLFRTGKLRVVR